MFNNFFLKVYERLASLLYHKYSLYVKAKRLYESSEFGLFKGRIFCLLPTDFTEKARKCPKLIRASELYLKVLPMVKKEGERFNEGILHCQMGALYMGQGYLEKAQEEYKQVLELLEDFPDAIMLPKKRTRFLTLNVKTGHDEKRATKIQCRVQIQGCA